MTDHKQRILDALSTSRALTSLQIAELTKMSFSTASIHLHELLKEGKVKKSIENNKVVWKI